MTDAFLLAPCLHCARDVLLAYDLVGEVLVTRCIHCEHEISSAIARPATADEVVNAGYTIEGHRAADGSRGCRDGQCGVRQPDH